MSDLWIPPAQADAEREALIERRIADTPAGAALERALRQIDDNLRIVFIGERAPATADCIPGRWHVCRLNPDTVNTFLPIATPDGGYLEPSFRLVEEMKQRDLWRPGAMERLMKMRQEEADRRTKDDALFREQLRDEAADTFRAAKRVSGEGGMTRRRWAKGLVGNG